MKSLCKTVMEAEPAGGNAPSRTQDSGSHPGITVDESAWRVFWERLLTDSDSSDWTMSNPPEMVSGIVEMAQQALAASSCTVFLSNGHGYRVFYDNRGAARPRRTAQTRINALSGPAAWVTTQCDPLVLNSEHDWSALEAADGRHSVSRAARVLCVPIQAGGKALGAVEMTRRSADDPFTERDLASAQVIGTMAGIAVENMRLRQSVEESYRSTISALASAIDAKDPYTCGHSQSVAQYSLVCGMALNFDTQSLRTLETGALLHDIGKIGIDDAILRKPDHLTATELATIRDHPVIGAAIVHDIGSLSEVVSLILHHHEDYDGQGYPHGLEGESIPLGARIIRVADAFDSMTTNRPYRMAMTTNEAMVELLRCRGTQFCPTALDAFAAGLTRYYKDLPGRTRVPEPLRSLAYTAA